jgi:hypothetical protein
MQLREAGVSFEKIAETLGYRDRSSARKAVLAGLKAALVEPAKFLRQLELCRLDKLWLKLWSAALATPPECAAVDRLLKIMQRRAALLGLDRKKMRLPNPPGDDSANQVKINWIDLYDLQQKLARPIEDPIEERIKQVTATAAPAVPGRPVSSGGN